MIVLVVDSNENERRHLSTMLRQYGHEALTASNGVEALTLLGHQQVEANPPACAMFGYEYHELLSLNPENLLPPDQQMFFRERLKSLSGDSLETVNLRRDGMAFHLEVKTTPVEYDGTRHWLSVMRDITSRKKIEQELRESEAKYRELVENANSIILRFNECCVLTFFNEYAQRLFGFAENEIIGQAIIGTIIPEIESTGRNLRDLMNNLVEQPEQFPLTEHEAITRTGKRLWIAWTNKAIRNDHGEVMEILSVGSDITERKKLEETLRNAQKMEAIGTLAGGIAHDFNNILSAIMGYTELALMNISQEQKAYSDLEEVLRASRRARDLVGQILAFSCQREHEKRPILLGPIIKDSSRLLRASLPSTIDITHDIVSEDTVLADPTQVHQIIMNLCTNAAHAMRETGGTLTVSLKQVSLKYNSHYQGLQPGNYLQLTVSDTGHGIDPTIIGRIFDPYFTTKERGEGTGLGLAVVHGIVKDMGGAIRVSSQVSLGSTFDVCLPLAKKVQVPETMTTEEPPRGAEHILFVDDEPALVESLQQILEHFGYRVTSTISSLDALELFRSKPESFDLVVTDYTMPHMTGDKLAQEILEIRPELPIIMCTGYSNNIDPDKAHTLGIRALLMKPLIVTDLAFTVRRILDGEEAGLSMA